jgi:hypothetical protein
MQGKKRKQPFITSTITQIPYTTRCRTQTVQRLKAGDGDRSLQAASAYLYPQYVARKAIRKPG